MPGPDERAARWAIRFEPSDRPGRPREIPWWRRAAHWFSPFGHRRGPPPGRHLGQLPGPFPGHGPYRPGPVLPCADAVPGSPRQGRGPCRSSRCAPGQNLRERPSHPEGRAGRSGLEPGERAECLRSLAWGERQAVRPGHQAIRAVGQPLKAVGSVPVGLLRAARRRERPLVGRKPRGPRTGRTSVQSLLGRARQRRGSGGTRRGRGMPAAKRPSSWPVRWSRPAPRRHAGGDTRGAGREAGANRPAPTWQRGLRWVGQGGWRLGARADPGLVIHHECTPTVSATHDRLGLGPGAAKRPARMG